MSTGSAGVESTEHSFELAGRPDTHPVVRSLLFQRGAWTHAVNGDAERAGRALGRAEEALQVDRDRRAGLGRVGRLADRLRPLHQVDAATAQAVLGPGVILIPDDKLSPGRPRVTLGTDGSAGAATPAPAAPPPPPISAAAIPCIN